jgi:hypothetical protein
MTIAGTDSGGGAGIQADLRTFALLGVHGCVSVAAVTVQNSVGVKAFHEIPVDVVAGQMRAVAEDIGIQAAKTGMLASSEIIGAVAETWRDLSAEGLAAPLVVAPAARVRFFFFTIVRSEEYLKSGGGGTTIVSKKDGRRRKNARRKRRKGENCPLKVINQGESQIGWPRVAAFNLLKGLFSSLCAEIEETPW